MGYVPRSWCARRFWLSLVFALVARCSGSGVYWTVSPEIRNDLRKAKVGRQLVPAMKEYHISMWMVMNRDPHDDPDNIFGQRTARQDPISELIGAEQTFYPAIFIFTDKGEHVALVERGDEDYIRATGIYEAVRCYTYTRQRGIADLLTFVRQEVERLNPATIGLNYTDDEPMADGLTVGGRMILEKALGPEYAARFVSAEMVAISLWGRKLPQEVEYIRQSAQKAHLLIMGAFEQIVPGRTTERDIFNLIRQRMLANGWPVGWAQDICPIVRIHPKADARPTDAVADLGDLVGINAGVTTKGYSDDLDRTAYVLRSGETAPPPEIQKMWRTLRRSVEAARVAMKPGAIASEVDRIARKVVTDAGYEEYWYQTGHPVGVWVHDLGPYIAPQHPHYGKKIYMTLQPGDVFAVEPGVSARVAASGAKQRVHLQEMIVVSESGGEYLIPPQEEIVLIHEVKTGVVRHR